MKNYLWIVLAINSFVFCVKTSPITSSERKFDNSDNCGKTRFNVNHLIIGGSEATSGQFPWQVSLQRRSGSLWFHMCGAVILNQKWLLTAAHCINGIESSSMRAVVGTHLLDNSQLAFEIQEIKTHESYSSMSLANDLALIQLKNQLNFDDSDGLINNVCLPPEGQKFSQYVTVSGWGTTVSGGQTPSNQLMFVNDVPIVSLPKCRSIYGFNAIREGMLCAGAQQESSKGFCKGDSGGPLIQVDPEGKAVLVGISSFNRNCGSNDGIPDVFVEMSYFRDWIDSFIALQ